jgi:membrane protein implicated in regulation of membrane protease activity
MLKKFYVFTWLLLGASVLSSTLQGPLTALQWVTFSLIAAALVYALALWAVFTNTGEPLTEGR